MLALLERNAAEADNEEDSVVTRLDSIFDDGAGTDEVHFISGWQDLPPQSATTVAPPRRRGIGAAALAVAVIMSMGVLAFGAMSWFQRCEPVSVEQLAIEDSRIDQLRRQEQELIALRQSHLATIVELEARIAALDEEGVPGSDEQISELTAALVEMKAEAHALDVAAELIGKKKQNASGRATPGAFSEPAPVAALEPVVPVASAKGEPDGPVEDNPYGDVSLASLLEGAVREEAFETGSEKPGAGVNGEIDNLIEQAVKGPSEDATSKKTDSKNTLPTDTIALPQAPSRASVRKVLGSMKPAIKRCGGEPYERLVVEVTVVGSTGRVVKARTIDSDHAGTPVGVCAAKAVKLARFPKFQKKQMVIKYPFDL
ncbi:MAG: hypothetical protein JRF63_09855 [Deltaproteobacteria bacterium]|nr:hypothetical protein [Deltaproteobacteria bacterium]